MANTLIYRTSFIAATLILTLVTATKSQNSCGAFQSVFHPILNHSLKGSVFKVQVALSHNKCAKYCLEQPACTSFNYEKSSSLCELNNATAVEHPKLFVAQQGSVYFFAGNDPPPARILYGSCKQHVEAGHTRDGIYTIHPNGLGAGIQVYCDQSSDGGGWIVVQRRQDGSVDFSRSWEEYRVGFGDPSGEFWLGNNNLRGLTEATGPWHLRVELEDFGGRKAVEVYSSFKITGDKYAISVGDFTGDAGDALQSNHNNLPFTTEDQDNDNKADGNCAVIYEGGWWFNDCLWSNLNGKYLPKSAAPYGHGVQWGAGPWAGGIISLKKTTMKIREML